MYSHRTILASCSLDRFFYLCRRHKMRHASFVNGVLEAWPIRYRSWRIRLLPTLILLLSVGGGLPLGRRFRRLDEQRVRKKAENSPIVSKEPILIICLLLCDGVKLL